MDGGRVEFVDDGPPPPGDDIDALDAGVSPRRGLPRRAAVGLAIVGLVAAGLCLLLRPADDHAPSAVVTRTRSPSPSATPGTAYPCRGPGVCVTSVIVPHLLADALRGRLRPSDPTITARSALREDATAGNAVLTARDIELHTGSNTLLVRVRPYRKPVPKPTVAITPTPPGLASAFLHVETPGYVVDLQWIGQEDTVVPMARLRALAGDPRLEALP